MDATRRPQSKGDAMKGKFLAAAAAAAVVLGVGGTVEAKPASVTCFFGDQYVEGTRNGRNLNINGQRYRVVYIVGVTEDGTLFSKWTNGPVRDTTGAIRCFSGTSDVISVPVGR
jgi:hypothetical protein